MEKHIIWSNNLYLGDWMDDLRENYAVKDECEAFELMEQINRDYLDDERTNFSNEFTENTIIAIADLGFWYGRRDAYKIINTTCIADLLYSEADVSTMYVDEDDNFVIDERHHDGTNRIYYRELSDDIDVDDFDELYYEANDETRIELLDKYTLPIGKYFANVYGF